MLLDLSELFRAALSRPESILLAEEIDLTRHYLAIEALRLGERLAVDWQLAEPLPATRVPSLSLQPLVEDAVHHGIEPSATGGRVSIAVTVQGDRLSIRVANDCAAQPARAVHHGHHLGQRSIRARLQAPVGDSASLDTRVEAGRYVAEIWLPL